MNNSTKYVVASQLISNGFNSDNLDVHRKLVVKVDEHPPGNIFSQEPWRYLNQDFNYQGDVIIPLDNIRVTGDEKVSGKSGGNVIYQKARSGGNPSHKEISDSIADTGYDLKAIPIAVNICKDDDGVYYELLDGRTRFQILKKMGVLNAIVDVFDIEADDQALLFGSQANNAELKSGRATREDIINIIKNLILMKSNLVPLPFPINAIGKVKDKAKMRARQQTVQRILEESINELGMGNIKSADVKWITHKVIDSDSTNPLVVSFPDGKGINEYLKGNFNIDVNNDPYVSHLVTGTGAEGKTGYIIQAVVAKLNAEPDKPVDITLYHGNPGHKDSEGEWLKATQKYIGDIKQYFEDVSNLLFDGQKIDNSKVRILGAVPQIRSLSDEFPMDKLVTISDFNNSSYKIKETNAEREHREREDSVMLEEFKRIRQTVRNTYTEAAG